MATKKQKTKIEAAIEAELPPEFWKAAKAAVLSAGPTEAYALKLVEDLAELEKQKDEAYRRLEIRRFENAWAHEKKTFEIKSKMPFSTYEELKARDNAETRYRDRTGEDEIEKEWRALKLKVEFLTEDIRKIEKKHRIQFLKC